MLWITGDTVLYHAVRRVPERLEIGTVPLHLGGVRFAVTGPLRHTMTAEEAADLCGLARPHTAVPIHYEGWAHFRQGRDAVERAFAAAPAEVGESVRWLPVGEATTLAA